MHAKKRSVRTAVHPHLSYLLAAFVCREQQIDLRFDALDERIVLGSSGLTSSLPSVVNGGLAYSPETQTVMGTFSKVKALQVYCVVSPGRGGGGGVIIDRPA